MPLLAVDDRTGFALPRFTKTIEVDGDWYEIKTELTGFERDQIRQEAVRMEMPRSQAERDDPDATVNVAMNTAKYNLNLKKVFIVRWSHEETLSASNLRRMPAHHDDAVLKEINAVMRRMDGAKHDSPLEKSSSELPETS